MTPLGFNVPTDGKPLVPRCVSCGLAAGCRSSRMQPSGEGRRSVLVVAEAPGEEEDAEGTQLVGKAGRRFRRELERLGWNLDHDCWKTNACCCFPGRGKNPTVGQIEACRANVLRAIDRLRPTTILLLGMAAVRSVVGHFWGGDVGDSLGRWVGWRIPCRKPNVWLCPLWHPSYLEREQDEMLDLWFRRHLEAALSLKGPPWSGEPPDLLRCVRLEYDVGRAAKLVEERIDGYPDDYVAVDYETDRLKPDHPDATVVSCALAWRTSDGSRAVAFPWHGEVTDAVGRLLRSTVPKIAGNLKFEERWTRRVFGHGVRNWAWDTVLAAHVLDNRPGVTGVKFQAWVLLGQRDYERAVGPLLKSDGGNARNRIREANMGDLLRYNAVDALVELEIALKQMEQIESGRVA